MDNYFITDIDLNVIAIIECDSYEFDIVDCVPYYHFYIKGCLIMTLNASKHFVKSELFMKSCEEVKNYDK